MMCGASKAEYDRGEEYETHAYSFINTDMVRRPDLYRKLKEMKFDVIIGNSPYQLSFGLEGTNSSNAKSIYNLFISQAIKLNPRYITMITPTRWMTRTSQGIPDEWVDNMLKSNKFSVIHDFENSSDCFPGVEIKGGVCYFLWDRDNPGECKVKTVKGDKKSILIRPLLEENCDIFIRYNDAITILRKVQAVKEKSFSELVSSRKPFGLASDFKDFSSENFDNAIQIYANKVIGYIDKNKIKQNRQWINSYKVYISFAYGAGEDFPHQILNKPILGYPNSCCTETYLHIGSFKSKEETENVLSYIKTKFFRFLVLLIKNT